MNSRERVRAVLERRIPDSVPRGIYDVMIDVYNDTTLDFFKKMTGKHPRDCFRHDIRGIYSPLKWRNRNAPDGMPWYKKIVKVETVDDLRKTGFYEAWVPSVLRVEDLRPHVDRIHAQRYASFLCSAVSLAQTVWSLRTQVQFLMDLADRPEWLEILLDWITEAAVTDVRIVAQAGPDILCLGDDIATQRGTLFAPQTFHDLFYPRYKRIAAAVKSVNPQVKVFFHCCGNVTAFIPDLIAAGIDILNPLQPEAMDPAAIKKQYGKDLVLWGGVGVQSTMSHGTPQDVMNEVKIRMATVGADGGYILSPAHMLNPDIPWENIVAFFEAADRYGNYRSA